MSVLSEQVIDAIRSVIGPGPAALHEPTFQGNEWKYLKECLDSTFVSSVGEFVNQFEQALQEFTGAKHVITTVNGTSALHIALLLAGVKPNEEVLVPALTFVATANAVAYCNATPHFVDSEERTLGIDAVKLRHHLSHNTEQQSGACVNKSTGKVIRALIPMHTFGHPSDLEPLMSVSNDFNIVLVEDAAESLGSYYGDKHTGTLGMFGVLSFNGNKTITTGGGGAILTNDPALARRAKHLTTTAKLPHAWDFRHDEIAYNYRMPNLNAALGCAQLEQLPDKLLAKRELFRRYQSAFSDVSGIELFTEPQEGKSNYWLQTLLLDINQRQYRDSILKNLNSKGFMARPTWIPLNKLDQFKKCPRMVLTTTELLSERVINIPSNSSLSG